MSDELRRWMDTVESFGGRLGKNDRESLSDAIRESNLGSTKTLEVTGATLNLPAKITLAEIKLPAPLPLDVSFSFGDLTLGAFAAGVGIFPPFPAGNGIGAGYLEITWGTPGANQQIAEVDAMNGWVHRFVASYLRIDYVPLDPNAPANRQIQPNQPKNISITATISPSDGGAQSKPTRTRYFPTITDINNSFAYVPRYADEYRFDFFNASGSLVINHSIAFGTDQFALLGGYESDGIAGQYPSYINRQNWLQVPQGGLFISIASLAVGQSMQNPMVIFRLAL